jgi:hypothetical protein
MNFFKKIVGYYGATVASVWGILEAYSYFQGDLLKQQLGSNWIWIYVGSLPVAIILSLQKVREENRSITSLHVPESHSQQEKQIERYQTTLGKRHKHLRENILKLNLREMSDFYGFVKTSDLEDYEAGLDEFPAVSIKKLEDSFFIRSKYLQEGGDFIFKKFEIISGTKDCKYFLEQDFTPYFLCDPDFKNTGGAYLVFSKKENEYWQMISSKAEGGFFSSGGGRNNVYNFIKPFLERSIDLRLIQYIEPNPWLYDPKIHFLDVKNEEWHNLDWSCWYSKGMSCYPGAANHDAEHIFHKWCRHYLDDLREALDWGNNSLT